MEPQCMALLRGIIRAFDPATWRATVELVGAPGALVEGIPVSTALGKDLLGPGTPVWLGTGDGANPADAIVLAPYSGAPVPWVSSRLWKPARATAERTSTLACSSTSYVAVTGLSVGVTVEVSSTILLLLAACGQLDSAGSTYYLALYHEDGHESTQLSPIEAVGGSNAPSNASWDLSWFAIQGGVAPGTHTFLLKHRVSSGSATLQRGRIVALAMAE